jgi:hypothetical protein
MAIPESQLDTWSHLGSVTQSAATYETIRHVLADSKSPYCQRSFTIFLQGSYGNDTNVYRDSDVDIVIRLNDTYYYENNALGESQKANFAKAFSAATYTYNDFKADVVSWLKQKFGDAVKIGTKAIAIKGNGTRRDADVLVCTRYRRYTADSTGDDNRYHEGICFFRTDGTRIKNFPKQHSDNCTTKHQRTNEWFKPTVRIYKNVRNRMVDENVIRDGLAPSYFIEGMLWNAPASLYGVSYEDTFVKVFNWVNSADKEKLTCANDLHRLVRTGPLVCWATADFDAYLAALRIYWNEYGK